MITGGFGFTVNLQTGIANRWTTDGTCKKQYEENTMICPECGEMLNYIDDKNMECCHCGWHGTLKQWENLIQAA